MRFTGAHHSLESIPDGGIIGPMTENNNMYLFSELEVV